MSSRRAVVVFGAVVVVGIILIVGSCIPWNVQYDFKVTTRDIDVSVPATTSFAIPTTGWATIKFDGRLRFTGWARVWPADLRNGPRAIGDRSSAATCKESTGTEHGVGAGKELLLVDAEGPTTGALTAIVPEGEALWGWIKGSGRGPEFRDVGVVVGNLEGRNSAYGTVVYSNAPSQAEIHLGKAVLVRDVDEVKYSEAFAHLGSAFCLVSADKIKAKMDVERLRFTYVWRRGGKERFDLVEPAGSRISGIGSLNFHGRPRSSYSHIVSGTVYRVAGGGPPFDLKEGDTLEFPRGIVSGEVSRLRVETTPNGPVVAVMGWFVTSELKVGVAGNVSTSQLDRLYSHRIVAVPIGGLLVLVAFLANLTNIIGWFGGRR